MRTCAQVRVLVAVGALSSLLPASAYAKRKLPAPVPPVVWQGVEYRAPLDVAHMGHVQAFDLSSGRKLWETKVYHVWINPLLEEDVQWVFVSGLRVENGKLRVRNEDGNSYGLDLKTGRVEGLMRTSSLWLLAGCVLVVAAFFVWVRRGGQRDATANESLKGPRGTL
jgi:outer membrane protein assembly factor BamB